MTVNHPYSVEVDEYIAGFPLEVQAKLQTMRELIREIVPQAEEKISYKMPTYALHGNLVHFAGYAKHIGFYPAPSGIEAFKQELSAYKGAKGSVQFLLDQPLPEALIRRIVAFRVKENEEKARQKKQGK